MEIINGQLLIGSVVADNLLEKYGSPLFVYEASAIREKYFKLRESIRYPKMQLYYSCKANSNLAILKLLRKEGAFVQVSSPGELYLAHKAGFSSFNIYHSGTNCSLSDVAFCVDRNVHFGIDSFSLLRQYGERYRGTSVTLRLNPLLPLYRKKNEEEDPPANSLPSKSGIPIDRLQEVRKVLTEFRLSLTGLHTHLCAEDGSGSCVLDFMNPMLQWAEEFQEVEFFNIGGGFGSRLDAEEDGEILEHLSQTIVRKLHQFSARTGRSLTLALEPGRYLLESAGYLLSTVQSINSNEERLFAGLNTGGNHLSNHMYSRSDCIISRTSDFDKELIPYIITGNLNEEDDILYRNDGGYSTVELPELSIGDNIAFSGVGAYAFSMATPYCGRLLPAEVLVDGEKGSLIRKRQTFEDLVHNQIY